MARILLYHGTSARFEKFDDTFVSRGSEPNSALGHHFIEDPSVAAEYAWMSQVDKKSRGIPPESNSTLDSRVLVVEADISKIALLSSVEEYLGRDPDSMSLEDGFQRADFIAKRFELSSEGFQGVCIGETWDTQVSGAWCIWDTSCLKIVGELTIDEASEMERPDYDFQDIEMVSISYIDEILDDEYLAPKF